MSQGRSSVGKEALSYCTSCKMDLGHVIVAMAGDRIVKVQCRTCKKEHAYRPPKGIKDPQAAPPPSTRSSGGSSRGAEKKPSAQPIELEWQKLMQAASGKESKAYSAKTKFEPGDKVRHPMFGDGVVQKLVYPNKVEIVFQMDLKVLIHGGA